MRHRPRLPGPRRHGRPVPADAGRLARVRPWPRWPTPPARPGWNATLKIVFWRARRAPGDGRTLPGHDLASPSDRRQAPRRLHRSPAKAFRPASPEAIRPIPDRGSSGPTEGHIPQPRKCPVDVDPITGGDRPFDAPTGPGTTSSPPPGLLNGTRPPYGSAATPWLRVDPLTTAEPRRRPVIATPHSSGLGPSDAGRRIDLPERRYGSPGTGGRSRRISPAGRTRQSAISRSDSHRSDQHCA